MKLIKHFEEVTKHVDKNSTRTNAYEMD